FPIRLFPKVLVPYGKTRVGAHSMCATHGDGVCAPGRPSSTQQSAFGQQHGAAGEGASRRSTVANTRAFEPGGVEPRVPPTLQLLQITWRHKYLLFFGGVVGLLLGALYYTMIPPTYRSTAQVLVVKKRPDEAVGATTRNVAIED